MHMGRSLIYQEICWSPLTQEWVKVNTDGANSSSSCQAIARGVIRDWCERWVAGFAMHIGICSITAAELWGIFEGLTLAWDLGYRRIQLETDSRSALKAIFGFSEWGLEG